MEKSKTMRLASGLLVLTLLSTCMVAGTFAKYTTSAEGNDTARAAKFGVTIAPNGDAFSTTYATTDETATSITNSVSSTEKVVAPGTSGNMASMKLTGTPEVAVRVNYTGDFKLDDNWTADGGFYCPLVIKVNNVAVETSSCTSAAEFNKAVNDAIAKITKEYQPGTNLANQDDDSLKVTWEWPFAGNDTKDTALGNATTAPTVTLKVTTTVTQID